MQKSKTVFVSHKHGSYEKEVYSFDSALLSVLFSASQFISVKMFPTEFPFILCFDKNILTSLIWNKKGTRIDHNAILTEKDQKG